MRVNFLNFDPRNDSESSKLEIEKISFINSKEDIIHSLNNSQLNYVNNNSPLEDKYLNDESEKNIFNNLDNFCDNFLNKNDDNYFIPTYDKYFLNIETNDTNNNYQKLKRKREKQVEEKVEKTIKKSKDLFTKEFYVFKPGNENRNIRIGIDIFLENKENQNNVMFNVRSHSSQKRKRKENSDNIRKKIKSRFIKSLIKFNNEKLKNAGSKKYFSSLPYSFVCNITKGKNRDMFNKTFKELFSTNFGTNRKADLKSYENNRDVLEYLENQKDISQKSNYNCYKNLKFYQIFEEYLRSQEFENEIERIKLDEEEDVYIYRYIKLACNLNKYFSQ